MISAKLESEYLTEMRVLHMNRQRHPCCIRRSLKESDKVVCEFTLWKILGSFQ